MQLYAEVTMVQRGEQGAVASIVHHQGAVVSEKVGTGDTPACSGAFDREQPLPGCHMEAFAHVSLRRAPGRRRSPWRYSRRPRGHRDPVVAVRLRTRPYEGGGAPD